MNKLTLRMRKKLTQRQLEILNFIEEFVEENNYPPTYREIGKKFNIASTFGVKRHIDALVKKGYLTTESNSFRSIAVKDQKKNGECKENSTVSVPLIGRVAAGYPVFAEENIESNFTIDASLIKDKGNLFGLKVRGDSMIDAGIFDGDLVIVKSQNYCDNGDIVVALVEDESTLKRFVKKGHKTFLMPENPHFEPIEVTQNKNFHIVGKVIAVYRSFN